MTGLLGVLTLITVALLGVLVAIVPAAVRAERRANAKYAAAWTARLAHAEALRRSRSAAMARRSGGAE